MTKQGRHIQAIKDLASHPFAWPGGYPRYAITSDGRALCPWCVTEQLGSIVTSVIQHAHDGWKVEAIDINWEDTRLYCDHCGNLIESAYGDN